MFKTLLNVMKRAEAMADANVKKSPAAAAQKVVTKDPHLEKIALTPTTSVTAVDMIAIRYATNIALLTF